MSTQRKWKDHLQIFSRLVSRELFKIFWVIPVAKRKILFESFGGVSYSCNPKYLSEYLEHHFPGEYEIVWSLNDPGSFHDLEREHKIRIVRKRSLRWLYDYFTAGVRISNGNDQMIFVPNRSNQLVINTWHAGGAYKRTGSDSEHVLQNLSAFHQWRRNMQAEQFNLFLSSSALFTRTNIREAYKYTGCVLGCGLPRNDLFFDPARVQAGSNKVRNELNLSGIVVLYAPTYRGDFRQAACPPLPPFAEIAEGIRKKFGSSPTILFRAHHADRHTLSEESASNPTVEVLDVSRYPDMQELLCAADLLVTDYSSSIWDYALLGRPCFLYVPDLEEYSEKDRGFFTPIDDWPGIVCHDGQELCRNISLLDEDVCRKKAQEHLIKYQSYEHGKACELTSQAIQNFIRTGRVDGQKE